MENKTFQADLLLLLTGGYLGFLPLLPSVLAWTMSVPFTYNAVRFALGSLSLLPLIWFFGRQRRREQPALPKGRWSHPVGWRLSGRSPAVCRDPHCSRSVWSIPRPEMPDSSPGFMW